MDKIIAAGGTSAEPLKNICTLVEERDKIIKETDIRIEYYKNALEKVLDEIKDLEKTRQGIRDEYKFVQKQNEMLESIKTSLEGSQEVAMQSLINHQYFEKMISEELKTKVEKTQCVEEECLNLYEQAQEKLNEHPLFRELEEQKVKFLKLDIKRKDLDVKIRQRKKIIEQRKEIQKRIFYNFYIDMAERYVVEERMKELKKLQAEELESLKRLYAVQEEVKRRQKLGAPRDKINRMTNISFGSQECRIENNQKGASPPQQKNEPRVFNEKLNNMFKQEEPKNVVTPPKVHILNQEIVVSAFVPPTFGPPAKRKNKSIDLSRKWQKLMKSSSSSKDSTKGRSCSQEHRKQFSQSSQSSQLNQSGELMTETPLVNKRDETPSKLIVQPQENQKVSIEMKENMPLIQHQMIENMNVGAEQFKLKKLQIRSEPSQYQSNKCYKPSIENIDTLTQTQKTQKESVQVRDRLPLAQFQKMENLNFRSEQLNVKNSQVTLSTPPSQYPMASSEFQGKTSCIPNSLYTRPAVSVPKGEIDPRTAISEQGKSVRFNLEQNVHQSEGNSMFGVQSKFANMFSPFSAHVLNQNDMSMQEEAAGTNNSMLNTSLVEPDEENSHMGIDFPSGENASQMGSPVYSYELEEGAQQSFKAPEMPSFGGGFFSFGKNMFKPF